MMKIWKILTWCGIVALFLFFVVCGVIGLQESGKHLLDACYLTMQLITLNAGLEDGPKPWQLEIARFALPAFPFSAILVGIFMFAGQRLASLHLRFRTNSHYVICGLGERGMALARDLLKKGHKVAVIDVNPGNPNKKAFTEAGGVFLEGNATDATQLNRAALLRAAHLILLTDTDATNFKILTIVQSIIADTTTNLKCHVHVENRENRTLFEDGGAFFPPIRANGLQLALFNVYENVAIDLFQELILGANADVVTIDADPVRLLISGFGRVGEAVLVEAMQLGHFCNQMPIEITVLDHDAATAEQRFFERYREVPNHLGEKGLRLWNLRFVDKLAAAGPLCEYTDILACHDDEDKALACIYSLLDRWQCEENQRQTRFYLHFTSDQTVLNREINVFGQLARACGEKQVIAKDLERMSITSHSEYNRRKLKDNKPALYAEVENGRWLLDDALRLHDRTVPQAEKLAWQSLSLLKQGSNFAEKRHFGIRLNALGLKISDLDQEKENLEKIEIADFPWLAEFNLPKAPVLLAMSRSVLNISLPVLVERIHLLAKAEHNRWNAFHVLNNFKYGKKNEKKKSHDCLLSWIELTNKKYDTLKYDYQNIYQIMDVISIGW